MAGQRAVSLLKPGSNKSCQVVSRVESRGKVSCCGEVASVELAYGEGLPMLWMCWECYDKLARKEHLPSLAQLRGEHHDSRHLDDKQ